MSSASANIALFLAVIGLWVLFASPGTCVYQSPPLLCVESYLASGVQLGSLGQRVAHLCAPRCPLQAVPEADAGGGVCEPHSHQEAQCWEGGTLESSPGCALGSDLGERDQGSKDLGQASPFPLGKNGLWKLRAGLRVGEESGRVQKLHAGPHAVALGLSFNPNFLMKDPVIIGIG